MLAGAAAGTVEHLAMFPLDTVKTRMQAVPHGGASISHALNYGSLVAAVRTVLAREGVAGLYRGVAPAALAAGPSHALYFAVYEASKALLAGGDGAGQPGPAAGHAASAAAGAAATAAADALSSPLDTLKARLQIANSPYTGLGDCAARTVKGEGWGALWRCYPTTLAMNVPFAAVQLVVYEAAKRQLVARRVLPPEGEGAGGGGGGGALAMGGEHFGTGGGEGGSESLTELVLAGGAAGGTAAAVTNPLDVARTRLQTAGVWEPAPAAAAAAAAAPAGGGAGAARPRPPGGHWRLLPLLREIVAREGLAALASGLGPRVLFHAPSAAVCWGTYEAAKRLLG